MEDSEPTVEIVPASATIDFALFNATEIIQVIDNATYRIISDPPGIQNFTVQAANQKRPYVLLSADLVFTTAADDAMLILDGLWFGSPGDAQFNIILLGDYECIIIRNCTLDPGNGTNALGEKINPVALIIEGNVKNICIEKSILGPVITVITVL